jgi:hypothetical protein
VQLQGHAGAGDGVPQLVGQPARELRQEARALRLADRVLHLAQLGRHAVD